MGFELDPALADALADALGTRPEHAAPVTGGDIALAFIVQTSDGRRVFVKTLRRAPRAADGAPPMFEAEARGLSWLREGLCTPDIGEALRIPQVLAVGDDPPFLALEVVEEGARSPKVDEHLGRGLALLHRFGAATFGLDHDNYIGTLPQDNTTTPTGWSAFYRSRRLEPLVERARRSGLLSGAIVADFERLWSCLDDRCGPPEPAARLHGDLWSGNVLADRSGRAVLIDPAVYGGHREVDLAMMRLFGGFSSRAFAAYEEVWPLAAGATRRVPLYQLYPLLVHVNLFGGGYAAQTHHALRQVL